MFDNYDQLAADLDKNNAALEALLADIPDAEPDDSMDIVTEAALNLKAGLVRLLRKLAAWGEKNYNKAKDRRDQKGADKNKASHSMQTWDWVKNTATKFADKLESSKSVDEGEVKQAQQAADDIKKKGEAQEQADRDEYEEDTAGYDSYLNSQEYIDARIAVENALMYYQSALESASLIQAEHSQPAQEGLFSKPKTLDQMLSNVKKTLDKKCKTAEDCDDLLAKLSEEEKKFNAAITTLKDAAVKYKEDSDKAALKKTTKPVLKDLKKTCNILNMNDIADDTSDITEDEIKKLRDFIVGAKDAINEKKDSFGDTDEPDDDNDDDAAEECGSCESFLSLMQEDDDMYAMEGYTLDDFMDYLEVATESISGGVANFKQTFSIKRGEVQKSIKQTIKQAKAAAKAGNPDEAIQLYQKAIKGYQGLLATAKKIPDTQTHAGNKFADGSDTYKGMNKTKAIQWCNDQISKCQAAIAKIKNKGMKADRKAAAKAAKEESKNAAEEALLGLESALGAMEDYEDSDPLLGL